MWWARDSVWLTNAGFRRLNIVPCYGFRHMMVLPSLLSAAAGLGFCGHACSPPPLFLFGDCEMAVSLCHLIVVPNFQPRISKIVCVASLSSIFLFRLGGVWAFSVIHNVAATVVSFRHSDIWRCFLNFYVKEGLGGHSVVAALLFKLTWENFGFDGPGTIFCLTECSGVLISCTGAM
jgi:hypothetical protein